MTAGIAASVFAGCARVPIAASGAEARSRLLAAHASTAASTRGVGSVTLRRPGERRGGARVRWAVEAESVAVAGYFGPARVLDAWLRADSLYVVLRHYGLGVIGPLHPDEGISGPLLRFVATPWDWNAPWVRAALERSSVEPSGKGWVCRGTLDLSDSLVASGGDPAQARPPERYRFALELTSKGAPSRCTFRGEGEAQDLITIAYGPEHRFQAGRFPRWIEWSFSGSVVKLTLDDLSPIGGGKVRYPTPTDPEWTIWDLNEAQGKEFVRWLLGLPEGEEEP